MRKPSAAANATTKRARPTSPSAAPTRSAVPAIASGHQPNGGRAAVSSTPAAKPAAGGGHLIPRRSRLRRDASAAHPQRRDRRHEREATDDERRERGEVGAVDA